MMMYRKILVAVDGSDTSNLGLREAVQLANETNAVLHLVHVVDAAPAAEGGLNPEIFRQMAREEGKVLLEKIVSLLSGTGVESDTVLLEANPRHFSKAITREAQRWGADLIVMGTHGRVGLARLVLGSVAEGVLHMAPVPVLVVRCF
jgi:nucleotide-binding universal stress UspA family protein